MNQERAGSSSSSASRNDDHRCNGSGMIHPAPRRSWIVQTTTALAALATVAAPLTAAIGFLIAPIFRRRDGKINESGFVPLPVSVASLPSDGTPLRVDVLADRLDAWNRYEEVGIGSIWLRRKENGTLCAFSTICPHLGCDVDYRSAERDFYCPCHTSTFDLDGNRRNAIPPRNMDELDVRDEEGQLMVRYARFRGGVPYQQILSD